MKQCNAGGQRERSDWAEGAEGREPSACPSPGRAVPQLSASRTTGPARPPEPSRRLQSASSCQNRPAPPPADGSTSLSPDPASPAASTPRGFSLPHPYALRRQLRARENTATLLRSARGAALALAALAALALGVPVKAQAQTVTLVSNTGQRDSSSRPADINELAQAFDTGSNSDGYNLNSIVADFATAPTGTGTLTVTVREDVSGDPSRSGLYTLINPTLSIGSNEFLAPTNAALDANTTYWIVASYSTGSGGPRWYRTLLSRGLDADAAAGWAIDAAYKQDSRTSPDGWTVESISRALQIDVKGSAKTGSPNTAPTGADKTVTTNEDTAYIFKAADFGFADTDPGDSLASVTIVTRPTAGTLAFDRLPVMANEVVTRIDIDDDNLAFTPAAGANGTSYASFTFKVNDGTDHSASAYTMTINVTGDATTVDVTAMVTGVRVSSTPLLMASGSTSADTYGGGETIEFTVTFSEDVRVTGNPQFEFAMNNADAPTRLVRADYDENASSETALVFRYTVQATDEDNDGIWLGSHTQTFKLDPGERIYTRSNGVDAVRNHDVLSRQANHKVDGPRTGPTDCPAPNFGNRRNFWTGAVTVATVTVAGTGLSIGHGFSASRSAGGVEPARFTIGSNDYTIDAIWLYKTGDNDGDLVFSLTSSLTDAEVAELRLHVCDTSLDFENTDYTGAPFHSYGLPASLDWSGLTPQTVYLSLPANNAAMGAPVITGTARAGETLRVSTGDIADADGLPSVFTYQWYWVDADGTSNERLVPGANAATYTPTDDSAGKKIKVDVSFTDNLNGVEMRTSAAYPATGNVIATCPAPNFGNRRNFWTGAVTVATVTVAGTGLSIGHGFSASRSAGGVEPARFTIGSNDYTIDAIWLYKTGDNDGDLVFSLTSSLTDAEVAELRLHVCDTSLDFENTDYTGAPFHSYGLPASLDWSRLTPQTVYLSLPENNPATGTAVVTGTPRPGHQLTADVSGIADDDGLADGEFTYQWYWVDADGTSNPTPIQGANAASYSLTNDDLGKSIKVQVSFTDHLNGEETLTSDPYLIPKNNPATGAPAVTGTPQVGQELNANISRIADADGLTGVDFTYQWVRVDADGTSNPTPIPGANAATYTLTPAELGKRVRMKVTFFDNLGNRETLVSAVHPSTGTVAFASSTSCPAPAMADRRYLWAGTVTVAPIVAGGITESHGFVSGSAGELSATAFSIGANTYTVDGVYVDASGDLVGDLQFSLSGSDGLTTAEADALRLHVCDTPFDFSDAEPAPTTATYTWTEDLDWSTETTRTLVLSLPENNSATGVPAVTGTTQVEQELSADVSAIADPDGLTGASFTYQWVRVDADGTSNRTPIPGANAATYTLTPADAGRKIRVRVSFTDNLNGKETRTSAAHPSTGTVAFASSPACPVPAVGDRRYVWSGTVTAQAITSEGTTIAYGFSEESSQGALDDKQFTIGSNEYTIDSVVVGAPRFRPGALYFSLTSSLTDTELAALRLHLCDTEFEFSETSPTPDTHTYGWSGTRNWSSLGPRTLYLSLPANTPATGAPTIAGTAQVGEELSADFSGIEDADGLTNVDFTYQWIRVDADGASNPTPILDATAVTYTLGTEDVGKRVKVQVSFTDNLNGQETRTSAAHPSTDTVAEATCPVPDFAGRHKIWTAEVTVETLSAGTTILGRGFIAGTGGNLLPDRTFSIGSSYTIERLVASGRNIDVSLDSNLTGTEVATLRLHVCDTGYDFSNATHTDSTHSYTWDPGLDWFEVTTRTVHLSVAESDVPPQAPSGLSAHSVSGKPGYLRLSWTPPSGGTLPTDYEARYRKTGTTEWATWSFRMYGTPGFTGGEGSPVTPQDGDDAPLIYFLEAHTQYSVELRATNAFGTGEWSDRARATTAQANTAMDDGTAEPDAGLGAANAPSQPTVRRVANEPGLMVRWHPPRAPIGPIVAYEVQIVKDHRLDRNLQISVPYRRYRVDEQAGTVPTHLHIHALERNKTYTVRVRAMYQGTHSGWSPSRSGTAAVGMANDFRLSLAFHDGTRSNTAVPDEAVVYGIKVTGINDRYAVQARGGIGNAQIRIYEHGRHHRRASYEQWTRGITETSFTYENSTSGYWETTFTVPADAGELGSIEIRLISPAQCARERGGACTSGRVSESTNKLCIAVDRSGTVDYPCSAGQREADAPTIEDTPSLSASGSDGAWTPGETVHATVTFSEVVTVDGTPTIGLLLGGTQSRSATYTSGTGTEALVFAYTLSESDGPHTAMGVAPDSLALNEGSITSEATAADAELSHDGTIIIGEPVVPRRPGPTAQFSNLPAAHDGETPFTATLSFSEAPGLDEETVRDALLDVSCASASCATVPGASRVTDREWTVTVEPSQAYDITLTLPVRACSETGAVCIGGRALAGPASATIPGRALTATLTHMPDEGEVLNEHKGSGTFEVRLAFNTEPDVSYKTVRDTMFDVTGATITGARRVKPPHDKEFDIVVKPSGNDAVTFWLHSPLPACGETGSVCTEAGRMIEGPVSATILGPVAISVADATVGEEEGATLDFAVTLDREREADVTVEYATSNGTATAGEDYVAQSGELRFAAGETAKTIEVEVLDDAYDEGTETMTLTLSNPSGARIADATATGSIENSDPMPKAWMVRFGRTVGSQVVDALTARLEGGRGSHLTVAGIPLMGTTAKEPEAQDDDPFALPEWATSSAREAESHTISLDDLLLRSTFHLRSGGEEGAGPAFTTWGRVATGGFDAEVDDVKLDGDVRSGMIGFDAEWERLLAGVMLSQSTGDGSYRLDPAKGDDAGTVESSLTGVYPYARVDLNAKVSAWALAGVGSGELTLHQEGGKPMPTDLSMRMGALGVKGQVLDGTGPSGMRVNLKSDAMWVGTKSARSADMVGTEGDVTRLRLIVQGERVFVAGNGATFTPSAEIGLRHDGGDAETGSGVEVGGGLRYIAGPLTIEGQVRMLVAHEESGYEEWGMSGAIRVTPSASGRGLTLAIAPAWGRTGSATERLWSAHDARGLGADNEFEAAGQLTMDAGYGVGLPGNRGVLTPYAGVTLGDAGARTIRTGTRWQFNPDTVVSVEATRQASDGSETANQLTLRAAVRF